GVASEFLVARVLPCSVLPFEKRDLVMDLRLAVQGEASRKLDEAALVLLAALDAFDLKPLPFGLARPSACFFGGKILLLVGRQRFLEIGDILFRVGCVARTHERLGCRRGAIALKERLAAVSKGS